MSSLRVYSSHIHQSFDCSELYLRSTKAKSSLPMRTNEQMGVILRIPVTTNHSPKSSGASITIRWPASVNTTLEQFIGRRQDVVSLNHSSLTHVQIRLGWEVEESDREPHPLPIFPARIHLISTPSSSVSIMSHASYIVSMSV